MPLQKWSEQIWIAQMSPEPGFSDEIDVLLKAHGDADPSPDVVIDLAGLQSLNSSNISQMLRVREKVSQTGSRTRIAGPSDAVWSVFLTTGLDKVFEFSQNTALALADLQVNP
jgi:anti-anti-sigma factor